MHEKREPLTGETPKHKKKSKSQGQPRSKHKHVYETVLLTKYYQGITETTKTVLPTKVCTICGRVDYVDNDESFYIRKPVTYLPFNVHETVLSEKALSLPKWYTKDFRDKFAAKE